MTQILTRYNVGHDPNNWIELIDTMPAIDENDPFALERRIVNAARVSYNRASKGDEADKKLIGYLLKNNHTSPFEQVEFAFRVSCPMFIARQWMRHRTWSYNEISRRYSSEDITFWSLPLQLSLQSDSNKQMRANELLDIKTTEVIHQRYNEILAQTESLYNFMIESGVAREIARSVLPMALNTQFYAKVDLHNLLHFLKLRMHPHAQQEMRDYAKAIYDMLVILLPWTMQAWNEKNA